MMLWGINPRFHGLSPCIRQVAYALRTRAPLATSPKTVLPLDLHVLSLPLAFILSQDQTLHCKYKKFCLFRPGKNLRNQQSWYTLLFFLLIVSIFTKNFLLLYINTAKIKTADQYSKFYVFLLFRPSTSILSCLIFRSKSPVLAGPQR